MTTMADFDTGDYLRTLAVLSKQKALTARGSLLDFAEQVAQATEMQGALLKSGPALLPHFAQNDMLATMILLRVLNGYALKSPGAAVPYTKALLQGLPATAAASEYVGLQIVKSLVRLAGKYPDCAACLAADGSDAALQASLTKPAPSSLVAAELTLGILALETRGHKLTSKALDVLAMVPAEVIGVDCASAVRIADKLIERTSGNPEGFVCQQFMRSHVGGDHQERAYIFWPDRPGYASSPAIASIGCFKGTLDAFQSVAKCETGAFYADILSSARHADAHHQHLPRYSSLSVG